MWIITRQTRATSACYALGKGFKHELTEPSGLGKQLSTQFWLPSLAPFSIFSCFLHCATPCVHTRKHSSWMICKENQIRHIFFPRCTLLKRKQHKWALTHSVLFTYCTVHTCKKCTRGTVFGARACICARDFDGFDSTIVSGFVTWRSYACSSCS